MKTNKDVASKKPVIKVDSSLNKLSGVNLFAKKFEESKAILSKAKLSFSK